MKTLLVLGTLAMSLTSVLAQALLNQFTFHDVQTSDTLLLIRDGQLRESFRLLAGGCLRGPLYFTDEQGAKIFELALDAYYPTGCGAKP